MPEPTPPAAVPMIVTARLRLRPHHAGDLAACAAMWADPIVTRYIGGRGFSREETWARLLRYAGHWAWFGYGFWAIEEAATGKFAGDLGFADFQRENLPGIAGLPEIGWALAPAVHGRGFAREAVAAALAWGDANLAAAQTACLIDPGNAASLAVAARAGYVEAARPAYRGERTVMLVRLAPSARPPAPR